MVFMRLEDLDISPSKIGETANRVLERAFEEVRRREHGFLNTEHLFLAYIQTEWDFFAEVMRDLEVNPNTILRAIEEHMDRAPASKREPKVSPSVKLILKLAVHNASRAGRSQVEASDLFGAIFEETQGPPVSILRRHGVEPDTLISRVNSRMRDFELRQERLKKKFELPPFLKHFGTNLNLLARQDKIPPVYFREKEISQAMEILCHRERPNSVILIGEPGVGKTAVVEGLASKIELDPSGVPLRLRDCQIVNLAMNTMVAGTMLRGMFEDRIQNVIREIKEKPNLILFIDEAHTMVGAGSALGAPTDAANVFKSVMARGEIRIIAATTLTEYKEYIEEDEALSRRMKPVMVREPTIDETRKIIYMLKGRLERNYSVKFTDEAIEAALEMSPRYLRHLRLPDKIVGWLDTAAVKVEMSRKLEVKPENIINVISEASRIPENMVFRNVSEQFKDMEQILGRRIVGQRHAIEKVSSTIRLNKGPLKDGFDRPDGVLLFLGPTGVGKTELAKSLAEFLFGDEKRMIRIDMSEYQDGSVSVDKLIGMPRGIVGSQRGGILTNQLKDNPYSVILLDEVEKAASSLLNLFLQAFDEGWLTDGHGKRVYLSDAIVIMTSNIGSRFFQTNKCGFLSNKTDLNHVKGDVMKELNKHFSPEFRNRIDEVIMFSPLTQDEVSEIANKYIKKTADVLKAAGKTLKITTGAFEHIITNGHSHQFGARFLKRFIDDKIKIKVNDNLNKNSFLFDIGQNGELLFEADGPELQNRMMAMT